MRLVFTKRAGKMDELVIEREGGSREVVACPKQGMIPHDMVHYAVEKVMTARGFLSRVASGEALSFEMEAQGDAEAIERMVETMQADTWSGRGRPEDVVEMYETACAARSHASIAVDADDILKVRAELDVLTQLWDEIPLNQSLTVEFDAKGWSPA